MFGANLLDAAKEKSSWTETLDLILLPLATLFYLRYERAMKHQACVANPLQTSQHPNNRTTYAWRLETSEVLVAPYFSFVPFRPNSSDDALS